MQQTDNFSRLVKYGDDFMTGRTKKVQYSANARILPHRLHVPRQNLRHTGIAAGCRHQFTDNGRFRNYANQLPGSILSYQHRETVGYKELSGITQTDRVRDYGVRTIPHKFRHGKLLHREKFPAE